MRRSNFIAILVCVVAAGCGGSKRADPNARQAAEWALSRGGQVKINEADATLKRGSGIPEGPLTIERIDLNRQKITDADLDKLAGLTNLKYLGLHSAKIGAKGIEKIAALTTLVELELSYTALDDAGLEKLKALPKLEKLFAYGTKVTKDGAEKYRKERPQVNVQR